MGSTHTANSLNLVFLPKQRPALVTSEFLLA